MASTFTPALRAEIMGIGDQVDTWGTTMNSNLATVFEAAIAGLAAVVIANANFTLSANNNAPDQARPMFLSVTSSVPLTAQRDVIVPSGAGVTKLTFVRNSTTGGFPIRIKTASGSGVIVPNGQVRPVYSDGTTVVSAVTGAVGFTIDNGLVVTAGGLSVGAGGATVVGNSTVTGDLSVSGVLTAGSLGGGALDTVAPPGTIRQTAAFGVDPGWLYCNGAEQSRSTYAALFAKLSRLLVADTVNGAAQITSTTGTFVVGFFRAGMPISGPGIQAGTTIQLPITGTTIGLSLPCNATASGVTVAVCPWGVGDGSTTFNVPDFRGRMLIGQDNMGVGVTSRVTSAVTGVDAPRIGAVGGDQYPGNHGHGVTQTPHSHVLTDPGHSHGLTQTPHSHGYSDPGHVHSNGPAGNIIKLGADTLLGYAYPTPSGTYIGWGTLANTGSSGIGISINGANANISMNAATTNLSVNGANANVTVDTGGGGTGANMPPTAVTLILIKT